MASEHQDKCDKLKAAGFDKVCVIGKSFNTLASSSEADVASAWNDSAGVLVNENQELANDWEKQSTFSFFKIKCSVFQKSKTHVVAGKGNQILVAKEYSAFWIVAHGLKKASGIAKKGKKDDAAAGVFNGAPDAYNKACGALFDELDEDED